MTLQDLRTYYRLREYQISHLLNAQKFFKISKFDQQLWLYLFYWADAKHEADAMMRNPDFASASMKARGINV